MIYSDVSQRRLIVDEKEYKRISNLNNHHRVSDCLIENVEKISEDKYLITITNTSVGDYFSNGYTHPKNRYRGLAGKEVECIRMFFDDEKNKNEE